MINKICPVDGTPFTTYPSKIKQGRGVYCSKGCCLSVTSLKTNVATQFKKGQIPHNFKGWRYGGRNGQYKLLFIPDHLDADSRGYIREHRYVMSQHLGRRLEKWEEVDHLDGNGHNNDISNLQLLTKSEHLRLEHARGKYTNHLNKLHSRK